MYRMAFSVVKQLDSLSTYEVTMEDSQRVRPAWIVWLEWGTVAILVVGAVVYYFWKPLNPMSDPKAAHALALVQTHPARSAPTIRQAIDALMQANRQGGRTPRVGDWTVQANNRTEDRVGYLVRVEVRLPSDRPYRWVEWEYLWLVRLSPQAVIPLSRPASEIMP
jgi:hypothetical protein